MGLFKKEFCPICGQEVPKLLSMRIKDKVALCAECGKKIDMDFELLKMQSVEDIVKHFKYREENLKTFQKFNATREMKINGKWFREDANLGVWYISTEKKPENPTLFKYEDIIDYKLLEDGETTSSGGLGRALAGGALFGGVGAVVGGVTGQKKSKEVLKSMVLAISVNNPYHTKIELSFLTGGIPCKQGSFLYKQYKNEASKMVSIFDAMAAKGKQAANKPAKTETSGADEILKFKELLDQGIITKKEFDAKKKELLGL
ncbi:MAG: SHOCT domain-containing protein [Clostridia bacterium]|nr:SHOCT domain-containing protein [Clostridia bacterium]